MLGRGFSRFVNDGFWKAILVRTIPSLPASVSVFPTTSSTFYAQTSELWMHGKKVNFSTILVTEQKKAEDSREYDSSPAENVSWEILNGIEW